MMRGFSPVLAGRRRLLVPSGGENPAVMDLAELVAHYDAQDVYNGSNPTVDTDITHWSDVSGNSWDLDTLEDPPTNWPTYRSGGPNGKNYLEFGAKRECIYNSTSFANTDLFGGTNGYAMYWVTVVRYISDTVWLKWAGGHDRYDRCGFETASRWDFPTDNAAGKLTNWSSDLSDNTWHLLEAWCDESDKYLYLDGVEVGTQTLESNSVTGSGGLYVGGNTSTSRNYGAVVDFAEIALYNSELTSGERDDIRAHLQAKYNL